MSTSARAGAGTTDDRAPINSRRTRGPDAAARLASADAGSRPPTSASGPVALPGPFPSGAGQTRDPSACWPCSPVSRPPPRWRRPCSRQSPRPRCRRRISAYDRSGGHRGCACPLGPACQAVRRPEAGSDAAAQRPRPRPADPDASRHRRHPDTPVGEAVMVAMELSRSSVRGARDDGGPGLRAPARRPGQRRRGRPGDAGARPDRGVGGAPHALRSNVGADAPQRGRRGRRARRPDADRGPRLGARAGGPDGRTHRRLDARGSSLRSRPASRSTLRPPPRGAGRFGGCLAARSSSGRPPCGSTSTASRRAGSPIAPWPSRQGRRR